MSYRIKEAADIAGISVRTLHHYDQFGLLKPAKADSNGYRQYSDEDLERLHQILFFKELGFSLQQTKEILNSPHFDRKTALLDHQKLLTKKRERLNQIIQSVETIIQSMEGRVAMSKKEIFKVFDTSEIEKHRKQYEEEARAKYGESEAYKESEKRTSQYSKEQWEGVAEKGNELFQKIAERMEFGPSDSAVQQMIGAYRQFITDSFYTCTLEIFQGLGELYISDERFTANIDRVKPGLARFLNEAIRIYCDSLRK